MSGQILKCGRHTISLNRPRIMGILNLTPDSFSDGGMYTDNQSAIDHAYRLQDEGADIIDIGAESTRPNATSVPVEEELRRLSPMFECIEDFDIPFSLDTIKPEVMEMGLSAGVSMINNVSVFCERGLDIVGDSTCGLCIMHMQGNPRNMQIAPSYENVVEEVISFLRNEVKKIISAGVSSDRICVDPGFGFGKTLDHNVALMTGLSKISAIGHPLLIGVSRKKMLGEFSGREVGERLFVGLGAAIYAVTQGAHFVRTHDVLATKDAFSVLNALEERK